VSHSIAFSQNPRQRQLASFGLAKLSAMSEQAKINISDGIFTYEP
jgi:hypothetical protein